MCNSLRSRLPELLKHIVLLRSFEATASTAYPRARHCLVWATSSGRPAGTAGRDGGAQAVDGPGAGDAGLLKRAPAEALCQLNPASSPVHVGHRGL